MGANLGLVVGQLYYWGSTRLDMSKNFKPTWDRMYPVGTGTNSGMFICIELPTCWPGSPCPSGRASPRRRRGWRPPLLRPPLRGYGLRRPQEAAVAATASGHSRTRGAVPWWAAGGPLVRWPRRRCRRPRRPRHRRRPLAAGAEAGVAEWSRSRQSRKWTRCRHRRRPSCGWRVIFRGTHVMSVAAAQ